MSSPLEKIAVRIAETDDEIAKLVAELKKLKREGGDEESEEIVLVKQSIATLR